MMPVYGGGSMSFQNICDSGALLENFKKPDITFELLNPPVLEMLIHFFVHVLDQVLMLRKVIFVYDGCLMIIMNIGYDKEG